MSRVLLLLPLVHQQCVGGKKNLRSDGGVEDAKGGPITGSSKASSSQPAHSLMQERRDATLDSVKK